MKNFSLLPTADLINSNIPHIKKPIITTIINSIPLICFLATFLTAFLNADNYIVSFFFGMTFILIANRRNSIPLFIVKIIFSLAGLHSIYDSFKDNNGDMANNTKVILVIALLIAALYLIFYPLIIHFLKKKREKQCTVPLEASINIVTDKGYIYNYEGNGYVIQHEKLGNFVSNIGSSINISIDPENPEIYHNYYLMPVDSVVELIFSTVVNAAIIGAVAFIIFKV